MGPVFESVPMRENRGILFASANEVVVESKPMPEPGPDEVLVETRRTLVSTGTELTMLTDSHPREGRSLPFEPGYNNIGVVVEVGEAVDDGVIGERVATYGAHQRYTTPAYESCYPVPDGLADEDAAFFTIGEIVMNGVRRGDLAFGESVAVYGLGLLGQLTARVAHLAGAHPVVALDIASARLAHLPDLPGVVGMNPRADDWSGRFEDATDGRLADVVFEVTGNPSVIPDEFEALREGGRFVVLGSPRGTSEFDFNRACHDPGYTIIGAHNRTHPSHATTADPWTRGRHVELFFELLASGRLSVSDLVTHREPVENAPEVYESLLEDRTQALGVVLEW